jgi:hypothetical protein
MRQVMACVVRPHMHAALMRTFYQVGTALGDTDQDIIAYHFTGHDADGAYALHGTYNAFVSQLAFGSAPGLRGREAVLAYARAGAKVIHYCCGAWRMLERRCWELENPHLSSVTHAQIPAMRATYAEHCRLQRSVELSVGRATGNYRRASCPPPRNVNKNGTVTSIWEPCVWPDRTSERERRCGAKRVGKHASCGDDIDLKRLRNGSKFVTRIGKQRAASQSERKPGHVRHEP